MAILGLKRAHLNGPFTKPAVRAVARFIPFRFLAAITAHEVFRIKIGPASFLYEFSGNDSIGEILFWHGGRVFEPEAIAAFVPYVQGARTVLDIGSNTGVYSMVSLSLNPTCRVIAWEPFPETYRKLVRNVELNGFSGRADLRCEAAGETQDVSYLQPHENWTMHTVTNTPSASSIPVASTTVDSVVPEGDPVDLVKIDVEGREYDVLCGAKRVLAESRPAMLIEIQPDCATRDQSMALLESMGYRMKLVDARANWLATPDPRAARS